MKRFNLYIISLVAAFAASSCSFLEREPDFASPEFYYKTESEMRLALNGVYNRLIDTNGRMYSKGMFGFFALSDEFSYTNNFLPNNIRHGHFDAADLDIGRLWEVLYDGVNRANYLIASFGDEEPDTASKRAILGEALFLRGYYYFLLTSCFGEVPLKTNPTVDPSEPYLAKSPLADIYDRIVTDMKAAEKLVYDIRTLGTNEKISVTGVQAVLARVYLKMAGEPLTGKAAPELSKSYYEQALIYANLVIASGVHSLDKDYSNVFINQIREKNDISESIWEVGMYGNKLGSEDLAGSVGVENGILCRDPAMGYSGGPMTVQKKLFDAFAEGDLRRDWAIADYRYDYNSTTEVTTKVMYTNPAKDVWQRNPGKWRRDYELGTKAQSYTGINFPLMRYSDVLLMKAEALNAISENPGTEAYEAINQVRRRAFGNPVDQADAGCDIAKGLSKDEFQEELENERFRELCFEGRRKWDLIRWGKYVSTMNELAASVNATAPEDRKYAARAGSSTTDRNVLFPIPSTELTVNKKMTQNTGW